LDPSAQNCLPHQRNLQPISEGPTIHPAWAHSISFYRILHVNDDFRWHDNTWQGGRVRGIIVSFTYVAPPDSKDLQVKVHSVSRPLQRAKFQRRWHPALNLWDVWPPVLKFQGLGVSTNHKLFRRCSLLPGCRARFSGNKTIE
jgi:hypothetical protein